MRETLSSSRDRLQEGPLRRSRQDLLRAERPGEACQRLVRGDATGPEATSHEERRHLGAQSDGHSRMADAIGPPALGEADDEQAGVSGSFEDTSSARADEKGLGRDSNNLLYQ